MRLMILGLCFGAALFGSAGAGEQRPFAADRPGWSAACNTYENRARFLPREQPVAFVTLLAEACAGALASLDSPEPAERDAAARFLARLTAFRDTVQAMNMKRVYGAEAGPRAKPRIGSGYMRPIARVSSMGEYLIAREMGVQRAFRAWLETGAAFSLASR